MNGRTKRGNETNLHCFLTIVFLLEGIDGLLNFPKDQIAMTIVSLLAVSLLSIEIKGGTIRVVSPSILDLHEA